MKRKDEDEFLAALFAYTKECVQMCTKRSEQAVFVVDKTLQILSEDANRISSMSRETIAALAEMRRALKAQDDKALPEKPIYNVVKVLKKIKSDHGEIDNLIMPIIQSLQFQDRVRQQMENSIKMISSWLEVRKSLNGRAVTEDEKNSLGKTFLSYTTTEEERVAIRARFPNVKEDDQVASGDINFF